MDTMRLTPEMEIGTKFEIFLEFYFKSMNCQEVIRNVYCYKRRLLNHQVQHSGRQADILFYGTKNNQIYKVLVEAKYSSNGPIKYDLREELDKVGSETTLTNLVDEILERQNFIGACKSILVTNSVFEDKLQKEAKRNHILLVDKERLFHDYKKLGGEYKTLDDAIRAVDLTKHNLKRNRLYCK